MGAPNNGSAQQRSCHVSVAHSWCNDCIPMQRHCQRCFWMNSMGMPCRNAKWRERRGRVDKDVRRTDRQQPFYSESRSSNIKQLRNILLTYVQYNNDLGYCQVRCPVSVALPSPCWAALAPSGHQHMRILQVFLKSKLLGACAAAEMLHGF